MPDLMYLRLESPSSTTHQQGCDQQSCFRAEMAAAGLPDSMRIHQRWRYLSRCFREYDQA